MFSSASCGSGKIFKRLGATSNILPSYIGDVISKLQKIREFQDLTHEELSAKADELTNSDKLWSIYFSGIVLDPARDHIENKLVTETEDIQAAEPLVEGLEHSTKVPIKLQLKQIRGHCQYGAETTVTSLLLQHYGSLHASLLIGDAVLLEWSTSGLIIPAGKPIQPDPVQTHVSSTKTSNPPSTNGSHRENDLSYRFEDEIVQMFEATTARKEHIDKLLNVIVRYNKNYSYHPIHRNSQRFVVDVFKALDYPIHPKLEGKLANYYNELKKVGKKKLKCGSHAQLDDFVGSYLQSGGATPLESECLLSQYFSLHITDMTECTQPERWVCQEHGCLMGRLEQQVDVKDTIAYRILTDL